LAAGVAARREEPVRDPLPRTVVVVAGAKDLAAVGRRTTNTADNLMVVVL
jgi:hypothetical protein